MENFKARYIFPGDYKSSMKILYLNSYQNYNATICLSFCFLWIGILFIIFNQVIYGLLLVAISLLAFFNGLRNLRISTKEFVGRHRFYPEYSSGRTAVFSDRIYINDSLNDEIKEYYYTDIECLIENEELFIIKLKFNAYIHIYKSDFTIGNPSELKVFFDKKNHSHKYIYAKCFISKNTIWIATSVIILSIIFLMLQ